MSIPPPAYDPMVNRNNFDSMNHPHEMNGFDTMNRMLVDGKYVDGSWELSVFVEDLGTDVKVRVLGGLSLGGLMHRITETVHITQNWSDYAIWWGDRNMWLLHNRTSLDQYGIQADAKLTFRRMHGDLRIILPSMIPILLRVNYSARVFTVVRNICKELNIRHSEELSLSFPITKNHFKSNLPLPDLRQGNKRSAQHEADGGRAKLPSNGLHKVDGQPMANYYGTIHSTTGTMMRLQSENSLDRERLDVAQYADCNFRRPSKVVFNDILLLKPKNLIQKARLNSGWLDSSRSLLEHGVEPPKPNEVGEYEPPTLYLCFKYFSFYDLNIKYDAVRLHQLYEQARWSILSGLSDCTEDEMIVFAAYQLQAELQSSAAKQSEYANLSADQSPMNHYAASGTIGPNFPGSKSSPMSMRRPQISPVPGSPYYGLNQSSSLLRLPGSSSPFGNNTNMSLTDGGYNRQSSLPGAVDEVDELLAELEQSCGVSDEPSTLGINSCSPTLRGGRDITDTTEIPSLEDSLRVFKDRTILMRRYKVFWVVIREARLYLYRSQSDKNHPLFVYALRDCTVTPDVSTATHKYILKLVVLIEYQSVARNGIQGNGSNSPQPNSNREEIWLRFEAAEQYARWLAACRLGSRGKTLASRVAYEKEVETILDILRLQVPGPAPAIPVTESIKYLGDLSDFCAERLVRKAKSKEYLRQRITEAHVNIRDCSLLDAKYKYIQAWQRLTSFGRSYFTVRFDKNSSVGLCPTNNSGGLFSAPLDDIVAVCQGRFEIISPHTAEVLRAWNFSDLRSWNVNWDASKVILDFRSGNLTFKPLCTNCKTIVEFIGGYVFLGQRTPEKSQECDERLFHRLTVAAD